MHEVRLSETEETKRHRQRQTCRMKETPTHLDTEGGLRDVPPSVAAATHRRLLSADIACLNQKCACVRA